MKKGLLILTILILFSCADKSVYEIVGNIPNSEFNNRQIYLLKDDESSKDYIIIDSAKVEKGKFSFTGKNSETEVNYLSFSHPDQAEQLYTLIIETGAIKVAFDSLCESISTKGTLLNDQLNNITIQTSKNRKLLDTLHKKDSLSVNEINQLRNLHEQNAGLLYTFIRSNIGNKAGKSFFLSTRSQLSGEQVKSLLTMVDSDFLKLKPIQDLQVRLQAEENVELGKVFTDLEAFTPDGKKVLLSEYVGKGNIVLLDFWASWCGPCIEDMPKVKMAYDEYKNQGFKVIGISLDDDKDKWIAAIKRLNIEWQQLSDMKGWNSEFVKNYPARPIPYMVLVDGKGEIIETKLSGNMLSATLSKYYHIK